jgi:hypothetical protein
VGLALLDAARAAGVGGAGLAAGPGWRPSEEMHAAAAGRGLACLEALPAGQAEALRDCRLRLFGRLGLGHFEGRSWRGFHHHGCLVALAAGFLDGAGAGVPET